MARTVGMMTTRVSTAARELDVQLKFGTKIQELKGAVRILSAGLEERLGVIAALLLHPASHPRMSTLAFPCACIAALSGHLFFARKSARQRVEAVAEDIQIIDIGGTQRRRAVRQFDGGRLALILTA
jgi:hypothetical protein